MWFSSFFENALVSRVNRRMCIRGEVLPLHIRSADVLRIGLAADRLPLAADAISRAVPFFRFAGFAVNLHQHGVIDIASKRAFNCRQVCLMPVCCQLHAAGKTAG